MKDMTSSDTKRYTLYFIYAALLLFFCSQNSPLFAYNDWSDPNVYMSVGKAINEGAVLYRDVFDHKGPIGLLFYALIARFSPNSMTGLYVVQTISLTATMIFLFRTAKLFVSVKAANRISLIFPIFLLNFVIYNSGGGSFEEILLPVIMGSAYCFALYFSGQRNEEGFGRRRNPAVFLLLGFFTGVMILSKINLAALVCFPAAAILLHFLASRQWRLFLKSVGWFISGMCISAVPAVVYLAVTNSFADFYEAYILFNLSYAASGPNLFRISELIEMVFFLHLPGIILFVFSVIGVFCREFRMGRYGRISYISILALSIFFTYLSRRSYTYMFIPLLSYVGIGMIGATVCLQRYIRFREKRASFGTKKDLQCRIPKSILVVGLFVAILASNTLVMKSMPLRRDKTGIEIAAEKIAQIDHDGDPVIVMYDCYDIGIYDLLDTYPRIRVFYMPQINGEQREEMAAEQRTYMEDGTAEFVFVMYFEYGSETLLSQLIRQDYQLILQEKIDLQGTIFNVDLLVREDLLTDTAGVFTG